jgi:hypothetical protein
LGRRKSALPFGKRSRDGSILRLLLLFDVTLPAEMIPREWIDLEEDDITDLEVAKTLDMTIWSS